MKTIMGDPIFTIRQTNIPFEVLLEWAGQSRQMPREVAVFIKRATESHVDLLAAAKRANEQLGYARGTEAASSIVTEARAILQAAIAKAKGGQ